MSEEKKWRERNPPARGISEEHLESLKTNARLLLNQTMRALTAITDTEVQKKLAKEFASEIAGVGSVSSGGLFAAVSVMEADMVGSSEIAYFRKMATFARKVENAIMGREPDDTSPATQKQWALARGEGLTAIATMKTIADSMEAVLEQIAPAQPPKEPGR